MANTSAGNLHFIDTASTSLAIKNARIVGIIVHCTHATTSALVELGDNNSGRSYPTLIKFEVPAANDYAHIDLSKTPLVFPNGIRIKTLTSAEITLILDKNTTN